MKRVLAISTIISGILLVFLLIIWPVSYHLDLTKNLGNRKLTLSDSIPIVAGYRLGFEDGGLWFYNYEMPFYGGTIGLSAGPDDNPTISKEWYWHGYGFGHETHFRGRNAISDKETYCDLPGVYFLKIWEPRQDPAYLTLETSLWYPVLSTAILPLFWIFRRVRLKKKPS